jgi:hypothetical protein
VAGVPVVALHALRDVGVFPSWAWIGRNTATKVGRRCWLNGWPGGRRNYPDLQVRRRLVCDVPARWLVGTV